MLEQFRNEDGKTYNGVAAMSAFSGIPKAELAWIAKRIQALVKDGVPRGEISAVIKAEAKGKPWETA